MPKYGSQEWVQALADKMNSDAVYQKAAKGLTMRWFSIITDCPDGTDKTLDWEIKDGKAISFKVEEQKAPGDYRTRPFDAKKYDFRATGSWDTYTKLNKKETNAMQAISSKAYKIDGPMMKLMGMMGALNAWTDLMSSIPVEY